MTGDCQRTVESLEKYILKYPSGSGLVKAHFYKGECNYKLKEYDEALISFNYILSQSNSMFTEQALLGAARIDMHKSNYQKAIERYNQLITNYTNPANTKEAKIANMRAYFKMENFENALSSGREVSDISKLSPEIEREATYVIAKSLQAIGREALALAAYQKIAGEVMSIEGAEAKYRVAELLFNKEEFSASEKEILDFSEKASPHEYWVGRSFILWGDIFAVKKEYFQAIQTLQSIIDYYEISDDGILDMANMNKAEFVILQEANEQPKAREEVEINIE